MISLTRFSAILSCIHTRCILTNKTLSKKNTRHVRSFVLCLNSLFVADTFCELYLFTVYHLSVLSYPITLYIFLYGGINTEKPKQSDTTRFFKRSKSRLSVVIVIMSMTFSQITKKSHNFPL